MKHHISFQTLVHAVQQAIVIRDAGLWDEFRQTAWERVRQSQLAIKHRRWGINLAYSNTIRDLSQLFDVPERTVTTAIADATTPSQASVVLYTLQEYADIVAAEQRR